MPSTPEQGIPGPELLEAFQQVSEDVFFVADPGSGRLEYVSPSCHRLFGRTARALLDDPSPLLDAIFPAGPGQAPEGPVESEFTVVRADGEGRWVRARTYPVVPRGVGSLRIVGVIREVTEQRLAERALRRSREELLEIVERMPVGVLITEGGRIAYANGSLARVLGLGEGGEVVGAELDALLHPDDRATVLRHLAPSADPNPPSVEARTRHRDGRWLEVEYVPVRPIRFHGHEAFLSLARDITGVREAERARRRAEARLRAVFEHARVGMLLLDRKGRILAANPALRELLGRDEVRVGERAREWIHPDEWVEADDRFSQVVAGEIAGYTRESRMKRGDGRYTPVRLHVSSARDVDRSQPLIITLVEDIREQVELEQQLRQIARIESIGRLAGGIAHDFNNLVTVIRGHTEMLLAETPDDDPRRADLQDIFQAGERAAKLTGQLLAFSRRTVFEPRVVDLNETLEGMRSLLERSLGEDVELILSPGRLEHRVRTDPSRLEQVIMNLVVNARDAMPRGGRLTVSTHEVDLDSAFVAQHPGAHEGPHVLLEVTDTGMGMEAELLEYIFEPFFTTKPPGEGTGLGLATVYGIVKQSGGYVDVVSAPGRGTTFRIYLPAVAESTGRTVQPAFALGAGGDETVLLVEDEPGVRALAERLLTVQGYRVVSAADGREALERAESLPDRIDLLITDVVMPGISGRELAHRLSGARPHLKVLFMSGYTDDALLRHGIERGDVHLLQKPFRTAELARAVRQALDTDPT